MESPDGKKTMSRPSPEQFYDLLAAEYDEMTGFDLRLEYEKPVFQSLVEKYHIKTAIDAGTGTGVHAILLALLGVHVTAVDISPKMLLTAQLNAKRKGVEIETLQASFLNIGRIADRAVDAVFCLGNSLPHILEEQELLASLKGFRHVLRSDGFLFLQLLNYHRILYQQERVQSIKEVQEKIFIRFYDYRAQDILFNILTLSRQDGTFAHSIHSVQLFPWTAKDLSRILSDAGFSSIQFFGSTAFDEFSETTSKEVVILARRQEGD